MAFATLICVFPVLWVVLSSFKTNAEVFKGVFRPSSFKFDAYDYALSVAPIPQFFLNSVIVSVSAMLINVTFVSMGAYAFARCHFKGKGLLFALLMSAACVYAVAWIEFAGYSTRFNRRLLLFWHACRVNVVEDILRRNSIGDRGICSN